MEFLDTVNWTRRRIGVGASFCGRGLFRDGQKNTPTQEKDNSKKTQKKANYKIGRNSNVWRFRSSILDTVAVWGWRIFLCKGVVQGRSKIRQLHVNVKGKKKANH